MLLYTWKYLVYHFAFLGKQFNKTAKIGKVQATVGAGH